MRELPELPAIPDRLPGDGLKITLIHGLIEVLPDTKHLPGTQKPMYPYAKWFAYFETEGGLTGDMVITTLPDWIFCYRTADHERALARVAGTEKAP